MLVREEIGYYVSHDGGSIIQYFDLSQGGKLYASLEYVEMFNSKDEAIERVNELAGDDSYFDEHFVIEQPKPRK